MGTLNTRISLRYDTLENWSTASGKSAVLNMGEVGVCAATLGDADQPTIMFKVGNGISTFEELPWTSGLAADVYDWAKAQGINVIDPNEGEIITNIIWDEAQDSIVVTRKSLTVLTEQFATNGMIVSPSNGALIFTDVTKKDAVISVSLT